MIRKRHPHPEIRREVRALVDDGGISRREHGWVHALVTWLCVAVIMTSLVIGAYVLGARRAVDRVCESKRVRVVEPGICSR